MRRTSVSQTGELGKGLMQGVRDAFAAFPLLYVRAHGGSWRMALLLSALAITALIVIFETGACSVAGTGDPGMAGHRVVRSPRQITQARKPARAWRAKHEKKEANG